MKRTGCFYCHGSVFNADRHAVLDDSPVCDCRRNVLVEIKQFCELGHADSWSLACEIGDGPLTRRTVDRIGPPYGMTGRAAESEERLVLIEIRRPSA